MVPRGRMTRRSCSCGDRLPWPCWPSAGLCCWKPVVVLVLSSSERVLCPRGTLQRSRCIPARRDSLARHCRRRRRQRLQQSGGERRASGRNPCGLHRRLPRLCSRHRAGLLMQECFHQISGKSPEQTRRSFDEGVLVSPPCVDACIHPLLLPGVRDVGHFEASRARNPEACLDNVSSADWDEWLW